MAGWRRHGSKMPQQGRTPTRAKRNPPEALPPAGMNYLSRALSTAPKKIMTYTINTAHHLHSWPDNNAGGPHSSGHDTPGSGAGDLYDLPALTPSEVLRGLVCAGCRDGVLPCIGGRAPHGANISWHNVYPLIFPSLQTLSFLRRGLPGYLPIF